MKKKKLAILSPGFLPVPAVNGGAVEEVITNIIDENELYGFYDIDLYTINDYKLKNKVYKNTRLIKVSEEKNNFLIKVIYALKRRFSRLLKLENLTYSYTTDSIVKKFKKVLQKKMYDEILVENNMDIFKKVEKYKSNSKLYFHLHNDFNNGDLAKTLSKTKFVGEKSDMIITVSDFLANKLKSENINNVKVLINPIDAKSKVDIKETNNLRKKYNIRKDELVFGYIGRIDSTKGITNFLNAINLVNNSQLRYLIVGNKKDAEREINKIPNLSDKLRQRIILAGYIPHEKIGNIYKIVNCIVIPTQVEEALGMVALEAMSFGKPIIAADSGALNYILTPDFSVVVKRGKEFERSLALAIEKLAADVPKLNSMGKLSKRQSKFYSISFEDYYKEIRKIID